MSSCQVQVAECATPGANRLLAQRLRVGAFVDAAVRLRSAPKLWPPLTLYNEAGRIGM